MVLGFKYMNFGNSFFIRNDTTELQHWSNSLVFTFPLKRQTECKQSESTSRHQLIQDTSFLVPKALAKKTIGAAQGDGSNS